MDDFCDYFPYDIGLLDDYAELSLYQKWVFLKVQLSPA